MVLNRGDPRRAGADHSAHRQRPRAARPRQALIHRFHSKKNPHDVHPPRLRCFAAVHHVRRGLHPRPARAGASNEEDLVIGRHRRPLLRSSQARHQAAAREEGYRVKVVRVHDYIQPNFALAQGSLDANVFQHIVYLTSSPPRTSSRSRAHQGAHRAPIGSTARSTRRWT